MKSITKPVVLGVGRVCIDEFLIIRDSVNRLKSTKLAAKKAGLHLGGSIPRILSCLTIAGYNTHFIGPVGCEPNESNLIRSELQKKSIEHTLIQTKISCKSIVIFRANSQLESIISLDEEPHQKLTASSIDIILLERIKPVCIIIDARQCHLALKISKWAHKRSILLFLDPGSTHIHIFLKSNGKALKLLSLCQIVCASEDFFLTVGKSQNIYDCFLSPYFCHKELLICTLQDGNCLCKTQDYSFLVRRQKITIKGNTMGAGDIFRGWFLAKLLSFSENKRFQKENVREAIKIGMAATAWKIQNMQLVSNSPTLTQVINLKNKIFNTKSSNII